MASSNKHIIIVGAAATIAVAVAVWHRRRRIDPTSKQHSGGEGDEEVDLHGRPWRKNSTKAAKMAYYMSETGAEKADALNAAAKAAEMPIVYPTLPDGTDLPITAETLHRWLTVSCTQRQQLQNPKLPQHQKPVFRGTKSVFFVACRRSLLCLQQIQL